MQELIALFKAVFFPPPPPPMPKCAQDPIVSFKDITARNCTNCCRDLDCTAIYDFINK